MSLDWLQQPAPCLDMAAMAAARQRQASLTKPPGALGRLEELATMLAAMQGRERPVLEQVRMVVFAADHGVVAEGVSAFPQAVTVEMIRNFARGGAAISVLAQALGASLEVVDVGAATDPGTLPGVVSQRAGAGSTNFCHGPALTPAQLDAALSAGRDAVVRARTAGVDLFIGGEMGIGNTTAAAAIGCALLQLDPALLVGPGTGLDAQGVGHKAEVVRRALALHRDELYTPLAILQRVGGFELAALAGAYLAAAQGGIPVLVDGFISTAAALLAVEINPSIRPWLLYSHTSAEPGHARLLAALEATPLLELGMRLGEGSGAAVAVPLLQLACRLHAGMATFAEAGVSEGEAG